MSLRPRTALTEEVLLRQIVLRDVSLEAGLQSRQSPSNSEKHIEDF
jgi:hypothetical protein